MNPRKFLAFVVPGLVVLFLFSLTGCQTKQPVQSLENPAQTVTLALYRSPTPTPVTSTPTPPAATQGPLPSPTPTYRVHEVKKGEDLGGIAFQYQVSLADLMAVNPDVNPYAMSVGISLNIPPSQKTADGEDVLPTPVGVDVSSPLCFSSAAQGAWCFAEVQNPLAQAVENVSAVLRVQAAGESAQRAYEMFPGLNTLPAGGSVPLMVYISQGVGQQPALSLEIQTALPLKADDTRYLNAQLQDTEIEIASRTTAAVKGNVVLAQDAPASAERVWVLAVAYNAADQVIGVRRHEMQQTLAPGASLPFHFAVYAAGDGIDHVSLRVEAGS